MNTLTVIPPQVFSATLRAHQRRARVLDRDQSILPTDRADYFVRSGTGENANFVPVRLCGIHNK